MTNESEVMCVTVERAGRHASFEVHDRVLLVGSGPHCDVRLLPEDAALEQLRIERRGHEVFGQLLSARPDCRLDGAPFEQGTIAADAPLTLGQATLHIRLADAPARAQAAASGGWPLPVRIAMFAAMGFGLYASLQLKPVVSSLDQVMAEPALFGAATSECPARTGEPPLTAAQRLIREAHMQRERAPFYPRDGVAAVSKYEASTVCLTRAGQHADAEAAQSIAAELRAQLSDEFHVRHVRLERFLNVKKYDLAQREVRILQDYLEHQDGTYAQWLAAVQRELNMRFASAKGKG